MVGGRSESESRRLTRAASVVVPFPHGVSGVRLDVARFVPSGRSLLAVFAIVLAAGAAYLLAVATSVFAVERVEVRGAPPALERRVLAATSGVVGRSLVSLDVSQVEGRIRALPSVAGVSLDRAFPHTLVVRIAPERPVAVARRGSSAWLVTGSGKVVGPVEPAGERALPRLWLPKRVSVDVGGRLPPVYVPATRTLAAARDAGFGRAAKGVRFEHGELTLALHDGPEIRLGAPRDLTLKVTIARRIVRLVGSGTTFVDVSVPERPVAG
jgi:cell division protein FtsQ